MMWNSAFMHHSIGKIILGMFLLGAGLSACSSHLSPEGVRAPFGESITNRQLEKGVAQLEVQQAG